MIQHRHGLGEADAGVGHRDAVLERLSLHDVLAALFQMAFDHHAHDAMVASGHLVRHIFGNDDLARVLLAAVGVRQVDHHLLAQAGFLQQFAGGVHVSGAVVGLLAAAQDHVAVLVAARLEDGALSHLGHAHEGVGRLRRQNGVGGHFHATVSAVLEAHGARQAAGQLAVALAFRGARADGAPAHQIADELWRQQIQKLGAHRQAQFQNLQQQGAGHLQAVVDGEAAVHARVVDVALPAHGGARFFEVHAHHHQQIIRQLFGVRSQLVGIFHGLFVVVDGARAHHHHQPVVLTVQHARDGGAAAFHHFQRRWRRGQPLLQ
ncbi:hypothetical protein SDC9_137495 [bioreactor metagenome]|uniref:Uncharacterized protein n=1 Tax=bioreactor metagenome TaxID=1076179 RepID=A0A645DLP5_9ZZZZ